MQIYISILKDLNKVLLSIKDLSRNDSYPIKKNILNAVSSIGYGEKKGHDDTLSFLVEYKFIFLNLDKYKINTVGENFLKLNPCSYVEISDDQKKYILDLLLENQEFKSTLLQVLKTYEVSTISNQILVDPNNTNLKPEEINFLHLLRWLNFFKMRDGIFYSNKSYTKKVFCNDKQLELKELMNILRAQQEHGKKAEELVLQFEKKRLKELGKDIQANLVKIVSERNVLLGYDLASFNGNNTSLEYDRFIEVKCSIGEKIRFFLTLNELNTAKKMRENYWIYFYPNISKAISTDPIMIKNPLNVFNTDKFKIIPTEFVIEEK